MQIKSLENQESLNTNLYIYLLRLADSNLILSQRLCELCGGAPSLEEELALSNVSLDLIGQARNWYEYASELDPQNTSPDHLAFRRDVHEFYNLLLVEQKNGNFADIIVRQFFFDAWHLATLEALQDSANERVRAIASKAVKEATYHLRRSSQWMIRLGDGTDLSHNKIQTSINQLWRFTGELLTQDDIEISLAAASIIPSKEKVSQLWKHTLETVLTEATLTKPDDNAWMYLGGKQGEHTEHLGFVLAEMQFLQRAYPDAKVW